MLNGSVRGCGKAVESLTWRYRSNHEDMNGVVNGSERKEVVGNVTVIDLILLGV